MHDSNAEPGVENDQREPLPRNVWVVTLTSFLTDISSEMILNLLPLFLFSVLGVRTSFIGLIEGVADAVASLVKMTSGWLSDRIRVRKPLAVLGYAVSTIAKPFLYLATSWGAVLGVRFADRVGKGLRTAPRDALIADSIPESRRGMAFGLHRAGDTAGAVVGIGLAIAIILTSQRGAAELSRETFQTVVLISIIPAVLAVITLAFGAQEIKPGLGIDTKQKSAPLEERKKEKTRGGLLSTNRLFRNYILIMALFTLGNSSDAFLILRAKTTGLSVVNILAMMMVFSLIYTIIATPAGALSDKVGRKRVLLIGWALYVAVYLGFARASAGWHAWVLMALYGVYYGLTDGVARAFIADMVPSHLRGTAYGILHAVVGLVALPASIIAGVLWQGIGAWDGLGPSAPFLFGAGAAFLASVALSRLSPPRFQEQGAGR
ncbi:MAG: MFS transporter [Anaerolineales bacterium]|jgi:MFS family permease|nr:MFS transporter [Anaerolineales bacterium]